MPHWRKSYPRADPRAAGQSLLPIQQRRLSEVPHHVVRVESARCFQTGPNEWEPVKTWTKFKSIP
jgi:hypothetical protein